MRDKETMRVEPASLRVNRLDISKAMGGMYCRIEIMDPANAETVYQVVI